MQNDSKPLTSSGKQSKKAMLLAKLRQENAHLEQQKQGLY